MKTPDEIIQDAARLDQFLKDPVVDGVFKELAVRYYKEFRAAVGSDQRVTSWAKANALEDVLNSLRIVIDAGEKEVLIAAKSPSKS